MRAAQLVSQGTLVSRGIQACHGVQARLVHQPGRGGVGSLAQVWTLFGARLGEQFPAIMFPPTCWSTAEETFCPQNVPWHVLGCRGGVLAGRPFRGRGCWRTIPEKNVLAFVHWCSVQRNTRNRPLTCTLLAESGLRGGFGLRSVPIIGHTSRWNCTLHQCTKHGAAKRRRESGSSEARASIPQ